ncbi:MAG: PEGA domain-containing protein [Deltaproteobacteria bacterium]|nr:PEGA domain-containing protein [Deltaproteobacteria bacterium]MBW1870627.1 PEGA domain-containing protein [Deltaproteobacteria bacterium]
MNRYLIISLSLVCLFSTRLYALEDFVLTGKAVDALDGQALSQAEVCVEGYQLCTRTDQTGIYHLRLPAGTWRLQVRHPDYRPASLANQKAKAASRPGSIHLWPQVFAEDFSPTEFSFGIGHGTGPGPQPLVTASLADSPLLVAVPAELPQTIRVARYYTTGCSGTIQQIDTVDFEDYVKGVVNAEVGVFYGVQGGPDAAVECWKAFAVAARSYALHFILTQPHDDYDINDTACNQVYKDDRNPDVSAAVAATAGQILVKSTDHNVLDRYYYAASCAEHGTEPAYQTGTIIPDPTAERACVGSWCGHDNCAGHADNPNVAGSDKCLVWGTCQWGSVERSMAGESYVEILGHYQPNCTIRDMAGPASGTIRGVIYRNPNMDDRIAGATVTLVGGPTLTYDGETAWEFVVEPGTYTIQAQAPGYLPAQVERTVAANETVWGSIGLDPETSDGGSDAGSDGGQTETDGGTQPKESSGCGCMISDERSSRSAGWLLLFGLGWLAFSRSRIR